jgi:hypothetical protein
MPRGDGGPDQRFCRRDPRGIMIPRPIPRGIHKPVPQEGACRRHGRLSSGAEAAAGPDRNDKAWNRSGSRPLTRRGDGAPDVQLRAPLPRRLWDPRGNAEGDERGNASRNATGSAARRVMPPGGIGGRWSLGRRSPMPRGADGRSRLSRTNVGVGSGATVRMGLGSDSALRTCRSPRIGVNTLISLISPGSHPLG